MSAPSDADDQPLRTTSPSDKHRLIGAWAGIKSAHTPFSLLRIATMPLRNVSRSSGYSATSKPA